MIETKRADAVEALAILFAYHIRQGGYDPDHSAPEDMAENFAEAVIDAALIQLEASEFNG